MDTRSGTPGATRAGDVGRADADVPAPATGESGPPVRSWAPVLSNEEVAEATWWLELESPEIAAAATPGQFVMVSYGLENTGAPFLPRPFSVGWRADDGRVGLLLRAFGAGTTRMSRLRPGDRVLLLGPLGQPFEVDERPMVCICGGVGLAPFIFLARELRDAGREVTVLYGERTGDRVFDPDLLADLTGGPARIWTEDGSAGREGLVTEGIPWEADVQLAACGPDPMLRAVARLARERGREVQVSVEEHMGCGVGTCQGCVVPGADGTWIKSCVEGPVFRASELDWERAAGG